MPCASPSGQVTGCQDQGDCTLYFPLESGQRARAVPPGVPVPEERIRGALASHPLGTIASM